jgi:polyisoprenyl-phosphate glycosyltransferase
MDAPTTRKDPATLAGAAEPVDVAVIVPVFHGRAFLEELCQRLVAALAPTFARFQIVLVDDGDPTGAWERIEGLARADARIAGVRLSRNFGQHAAIAAGIDIADAAWYVVMDCDLQDPPEHLPALYRAAVQDGYDMVIARRETFAANARRHVGSRLFYFTLKHLADLDLGADQGTFRIFSAPVAEAYRRMREQARFLPALMARIGFHVGHLTVPRAPRRDRPSSYSSRKLVALAIDTALTHSEKPLMLGVLASLLFAAAALAAALYVVVTKVIFGVPVDGWTSIIVTICLIGSLQLLLTSIIGLYVGKTFNEAKARPAYFVRDRINI